MYARCFATILSLNLAGAKQHAATAGTAMNGTEQIHAGPREDAELQQLRWELAQARAKAAEAEANAAAAQRAEAQAKQALDDALATQATGELYGALFSSFFLLAVLGAFLWLRNSYAAQNAQQMSTIVHLNEERVKILTRLAQRQTVSGEGEGLSKPLIPKG
mmetsp:Transcript_63029/g.148021  ORF Transcript_63029/g.148021 Transcript_63029/m.148021 type:complete len:162 (+) Transcript_63029:64-549(+)